MFKSAVKRLRPFENEQCQRCGYLLPPGLANCPGCRKRNLRIVGWSSFLLVILAAISYVVVTAP